MAIKNKVVELAVDMEAKVALTVCGAGEWEWLTYVVGSQEMATLINCDGEPDEAQKVVTDFLEQWQEAAVDNGANKEAIEETMAKFKEAVDNLLTDDTVYGISVFNFSVDCDFSIGILASVKVAD